MSGKGFENELARALARPDVEQLRNELAEAFKWNLWLRNGEDKSVPEADRGMYVDSPYYDREGQLAMCVIAMSEYDDPSFLGLLSAGPLEDSLDTHPWQEPISDEFLARIVNEARRTPRFRWMLSGVWTYSAEPHVAEAVREAVGNVKLEDPLPPRPCA